MVNQHSTYLTREELVLEWRHTWPRHKGCVSLAAPILGTTAAALSRRLYRMRADGYTLNFHDDTQRVSA